MNSSTSPNSPAPFGNRMKLFVSILFILLAAHFLMVHLKPSWVGVAARPELITNPRKFISPGFGSGPGMFPSAGHMVIEEGGQRYLWGGKYEGENFLIDKFRLEPDQLHHGLGRENFARRGGYYSHLRQHRTHSVDQIEGRCWPRMVRRRRAPFPRK